MGGKGGIDHGITPRNMTCTGVLLKRIGTALNVFGSNRMHRSGAYDGPFTELLATIT
jgi:hypothetical protein